MLLDYTLHYALLKKEIRKNTVSLKTSNIILHTFLEI